MLMGHADHAADLRYEKAVTRRQCQERSDEKAVTSKEAVTRRQRSHNQAVQQDAAAGQPIISCFTRPLQVGTKLCAEKFKNQQQCLGTLDQSPEDITAAACCNRRQSASTVSNMHLH